MSVQVEGYRSENFESLEAAVLETQRGRWFLEEFARRQRAAENQAILEILKRLETSFVGNAASQAPTAAETAKPLNREQLKFFKQDEEIFVEPVIAAPALAAVPEPTKEEPKLPVEPRGAKLKIQRVQPMPATDEAITVEPEAPAPAELLAAPEPVATISPQLPEPEPKQRVVIIRRPASEATEIPMVDENSAEVAA